MFDDALPERLVAVGGDNGAHSVHLDRGTGTPSPYIVKLRETPIASAALAPELAELANSFIIDSDDDEAEPLLGAEDADDDLAIASRDLVDQLREFDTHVSPVITEQAAMTSRETCAPRLSLDDALAGLDEVVEWSSNHPAPAPGVPEVAAIASSPWVYHESVTVSEAPEVVVTQRSWIYHPTLRAFAVFLGLSFALVMPLRAMQSMSGAATTADTMTAIGRSAIDDLTRGAASLSDQRFDLAQDDFSRAAAKFSTAEATLGELHTAVVAVVSVIPQTDRTYDSVRGLVTAGRELSETATIMSGAATDIESKTSIDLVTKLELLATYVESALPHVSAAAAALDGVDPNVVPADYTMKVATLKAQAPSIAASMQEFLTLVNTFATMLGGNGKMRYLAVFQNNTEIRPTGGFIGSFAQIDVDDGAIAAMSVPGGGSYAMQGQLQAFVEAPEPLSLINPRWEFQDANWFPDFPSSAAKLQWFYERSGGPSTDGVLAVNANFLVELLGVLGPVDMPKYGRTIDAENFMFEAQKIVELEYDKTENAPKAFIGDLAPVLLDRLTNADISTLLSVMRIVEEGLHNRDIQVYFEDNDIQAAMRSLGWTGEVKQTDGDYFMAVNTNVGGGKTDGVISETVAVNVDVQNDGTIIDNVTITRTHNGLASAVFSGKNNVDYLRLYVPEGSVLLSADGFTPPDASLFDPSLVPLTPDEDLAFLMSDKTVDGATGVDVWNEFNKTVFGAWVQTAPGETSTIHFSYRIPNVVFSDDATDLLSAAKRQLGFGRGDSYSMFVQKQSGVAMRETTVTLSLPANVQQAWSTFAGDAGGLVAATDNRSDAYFGWLMTRK